MRLLLPPHIGWPLLVVVLLSISISASVYTLIAAGSNGGAQVVDDYYQRALHWDDERAQRESGKRLGWALSTEVEPTSTGSLRPVTISITESDGTGVGDLRGTVRLSRPQLSGTVAEIPLQEIGERPGTYRQLMPIDAGGLWDFEVHAQSGDNEVRMSARVEVGDERE